MAPQRPMAPAFDAAEFGRRSRASKEEAGRMAEEMAAARRKTPVVPASPEFIRAAAASVRAAFPPCSDEERAAALWRGVAESRARQNAAA